MKLFTRRDRPPANLVEQFADDERLVSWADTADGAVVAATSHGLWWPEPSPRRIDWQRVDKVVWRDGVITVTEADLVDDELLVDRPVVRATLTVARDLPPTVRKRVEQNIVRTELLTIGGGAVRFVARRRPGQDGVAWWAHLEPGTRDTEPVRAAIRARLAILRAE